MIAGGKEGELYLGDKRVGDVATWSISTGDAEIIPSEYSMSGVLSGKLSRCDRKRLQKLVAQFKVFKDYTPVEFTHSRLRIKGTFKLSIWQRLKLMFLKAPRIKLRGHGEIL